MARVRCRVRLCAWPLALLLGGAMLPAPASAQAPAYLTQWGTAGSGSGQFHDAWNIAADQDGNVYVEDWYARIQKFSSDGVFLTQWGTYGCESGQFGPFTALATDASGSIYVADNSCARIHKFSATGTLLTEWDVPSPGGVFFPNSPRSVAVDAAGAVYVGYFNFDFHLAGIMKFTDTGVLLADWRLNEVPGGLATDPAGNVYATFGRFIKKFTSDGALLSQWGDVTDNLYGIAVDAHNNVYVSESTKDRVMKFTTEGTLLAEWGSFGTGDGQFNDPRGIALDDEGNIYVVDSVNQRVQKFGYIPTDARPATWGQLKRFYR